MYFHISYIKLLVKLKDKNRLEERRVSCSNSYLASNLSSSSESSTGTSNETGEAGDCGNDGPLPDSYSSSVGPAPTPLPGPDEWKVVFYNNIIL